MSGEYAEQNTLLLRKDRERIGNEGKKGGNANETVTLAYSRHTERNFNLDETSFEVVILSDLHPTALCSFCKHSK